jgi:ComF family protein
MPLPQLVRDVVDFVYPVRCASCAADFDGGGFLCQLCNGQLDMLASAPACRYCARPIVGENAPCPWCRGEGLHPFQTIIRLGKFDDPLKQLIHRMKYNRRWNLAGFLAERLVEEERVRELMKNTETLVPVPLHWRRQISRGYNQADELAAALARRCKLKLIHAVKRVRPTETQTSIHSRTLREENVRGAFALRKWKSLAGKRIVLIDDVMTTAATLQTVGRALKPAKPASISAIVLAVADPKGRDFQGI